MICPGAVPGRCRRAGRAARDDRDESAGAQRLRRRHPQGRQGLPKSRSRVFDRCSNVTEAQSKDGYELSDSMAAVGNISRGWSRSSLIEQLDNGADRVGCHVLCRHEFGSLSE